ncbi:MAG: hypothetical protein ACI35O_10855, partial [Bacillaceae bacterium]
MEIIELISYKLRRDLVEIKIARNSVFEKDVSFYLVNRDSKVSMKCAATISLGEREITLSFSLSKVQFDDSDVGILDVYLMDKKENTYRLALEKLPLGDAAGRYATNSYIIDYKRSAIPYVTTRKELGIVFGHSLIIMKNFATIIDSNKTILDLKFTQIGMKMILPKRDIQQNMYVTTVNRKNQRVTILKYEVLDRNEDTVEILVFFHNKWLLNERHDLYLQCKDGKRINRFRLGINDDSVGIGENKYYDPIKLEDNCYLLPYVTVKGEISFYIGNALTIDKAAGKNQIQSKLYFNRMITTSHEVQLLMDEGQVERIKQFKKQQFILHNNDKGIVKELNAQSVGIDDNGIITFRMNEIFQKSNWEMEDNWKLILKLEELEMKQSYDIEPIDYSGGVRTLVEPTEKIEQEAVVEINWFVKKTNWVQEASERYTKPMNPCKDVSVITYLSDRNELAFLIGDEEVYTKRVYEKIATWIEIENLIINDTSIHFDFVDPALILNKEVRIFFENRKLKEIYPIDFVVENGVSVHFDLTKFVNQYIETESRWDVYVQLRSVNIIEEGKIGLFSEQVKSTYERYFTSIKRVTVDGSKAINVVTPYLSVKNELAIVIRPEINLFNERFKAKIDITTFKMNKNIVHIEANLSINECSNYSIHTAKLRFRNKATFIEHQIGVTEKKVTENNSLVSFTLNLDEYKLQPFYWDIFIVVTIGNDEVYVKLKNPTKAIRKQIDNKILKYEYLVDEKTMIYPYVTQDNAVAFCYRERANYETWSYKVKEKAAFVLYSLFKGYFDKKDIWLGYEKSASTAQDNGYHFFNHCYENNKHKNFYYIIKADSPDYKDLQKQKDKVLKFMSFKYMLYLYASKLLISSESKGHSYDIRIQKGELKKALDKKKFV